MSSKEDQVEQKIKEDVEFVDADSDDDDDEEEEDGQEVVPFVPGKGEVGEDEEMVQDESAYIMYHQAQTGSPCLSFDILKDNLGENRSKFPHTAYLVAGTQAEQTHLNNVIIMRMSNLKKMKQADEDDEDDDSDSILDSDEDEEGDLPELKTAMISHLGGVNRIRSTIISGKHIAATWADTGRVHIWNISPAIESFEYQASGSKMTKDDGKVLPVYTFTGHQIEGFALDWSPTVEGNLITGDCKKNIHLWKMEEGGTWKVDQRPYAAHTESVEDLQWSPNEKTVFASCSVDKSIRIWDIRAPPSKACMITVENCHDSDVNVINWNKKEPFIVSGGDDGVLNIWDLRQFQKKSPPIAKFKQHSAPVTCVEWHPTDCTVFLSSGADNQITLWDLALERDPDADPDGQSVDVPPQLLFIHQGQKDIKECHWHPQIPGLLVSTALSGFNIFKTISV
ncbi:Glutamate-rich WD repeat-containing protein 1 [Holothuria leucospilota]|uniref:Glutamate-rich WD repeat-containing protein 1 n=1 Tax=Holothuria leucospilota TaxID=206669 RepID=A0A9Q1H643_HOLLE|nr:Glutamate-rich WD repeat-containing protein 1 [Holothuria leucospilota]